jgi:uncharacterized protein with NRDE domain
MCLILLAWNRHPEYRLIMAANRDEFHARPTASAAWWPDPPGILAGRDLVGGGTWCGVDRRGRWAAVTNFRDFRDPAMGRENALSRGLLVRDFLASGAEATSGLTAATSQAQDYRPFNLLAGDGEAVAYFGSREERVRMLSPGVYGLSNALLDTPWPKVVGGKAALAQIVREGQVTSTELFALLADRAPAPDSELPDTGVGLERERLLSSRFICSAEYGTRCSTLLLVRVDGEVVFHERRFAADGSCKGEVREVFRARFGPREAAQVPDTRR